MREKEVAQKDEKREEACTDQRTDGLSLSLSLFFSQFPGHYSLFHSQILLRPQYPVSAVTFISLPGAHVSLNTAPSYILFVFG